MNILSKSSVLWSLLFLLLTADGFSAEYYFRFPLPEKAELQELTREISIHNVRDGWVYAYANDAEFAAFKNRALSFEILAHPGTLFHPRMTGKIAKGAVLDAYPTYPLYVAMMTQFAASYPGICRLEHLGWSVNGRELLAVKISNHVESDEAEPEFFYTSTMHGDETAGYILMLRLIDHLLTNYGTDASITGLIDSCEIWINPLANPDGLYYLGDTTVYGATRYNAHGRDLNRSFPVPGESYQVVDLEPEVAAMVQFAGEHHFVMGANCHSGTEVLNYPWDLWERRHPDDAWFQQICRDYADRVHAVAPAGYLTDLENGITNGWDWYTIDGGRQDYMNYYQHCREVTFELSDGFILPDSLFESYWQYNRVALLGYIKNVTLGIHGVVTDPASNPLKAEVLIHEHDVDSSQVFSSAVLGDFHRPIAPGVWTLEVSAPNFQTAVLSNIDLTTVSRIDLEVVLVPTQFVKGDIDGNGRLDETDVDLLIKLILDEKTDQAAVLDLADMNNDGRLDVRDSVLLINEIKDNPTK